MTNDQNRAGDSGKDSGGLSEILRLQAVALARMSERLAGQQEPESPALPVPRAAPHDTRPRHEDQFPVLASDAALSDESLPVLNTFKKFLEAERRRARRRVIWISLAFGAGMVVIMGALAWLGRERIAELRQAIGTASAQANESRLKTDAEIKKVSESAITLKQDLWRTVLSSHSMLSSNLNTKWVGREAEVDQLKEKLSALEIENAMLVGRLKELADTTMRLQESYETWIEKSASVEPAGQVQTGVVSGASPTEAKNLPLLINAPGYGRAVNLRLPSTP